MFSLLCSLNNFEYSTFIIVTVGYLTFTSKWPFDPEIVSVNLIDFLSKLCVLSLQFTYCVLQLIDSSNRDEPIGRWGETGVPRENHLTHPQAELCLSHMWPVRGSNLHRTRR